ncbi:fatty acyl-CoA reductase wat-like isoform X1 [Bacillus rossius redtenbacheri]|uniref:fatty acyl-CoA reductase wat-like isoform X1 n=2 Tax=Bacillus rossius redtenbacheri TaxID=93214 RepID=UPI002FDCB877
MAGGSSEVQRFYKDCGVFVTGGTGFLGKLTIEKILRSCPDVRKVYVLIRPKKGLSIEERKKALLDNVVFDLLKHEQPDAVDKIVFVAGDCSSPRLGLSDSDYYHLTQHVNIMLHLAANVRFDETMKVAINTNIKGTMEAVRLCWDCFSLKAAVFVTTAFSNVNCKEVREEFYDPPMQLEEVLALMDRVSEQELEIFSHKVTGARKIPYLFSKAVTENLILTHAKGLPIAIVRPSMVVSTVREPIPGWLDNMYGPISIVTGVGTGVLRVNNADIDLVLDLVPADMVTNCILSVASTMSMSSRSNDGITIYNVVTSDKNPITIRLMKEMFIFCEKFPLKTVIWYPFMLSVPNFKLYTFLTLFLHVLPGCLLDLVLRLKGKPPMLLKIYKKIRKFAIIMNMISMKEITFFSDNLHNLYEQLGSEDKEMFFFDMKQINWVDYMFTACLESRKYLLNETLDDLELARSRYRRLYIVHTFVKYLLFGLAIYAAWLVIVFFTHSMF